MKSKLENTLGPISSLALSFFNDKDLSSLLGTSRTLKAAGTLQLEQRKPLKQVVLGKQDEAEALIITNPKCLLIKSQTQDYSGRTIIATPFQAAIGAGDKPMWEMILKYIPREEALKQFREWFPNGIKEETPAEALQAGYNAIALEIIKGKESGQAAIARFREQITAQKEIRQGLHFNLSHLIAAYQAYINHFDALGNWENRDLFWKQVIGYVQRQMTAYDAQIHCTGVQKVLNNPVAFSRSLRIYNGGEFFPLAINSGLGFDFGVYSYYDAPAGLVGSCAWRAAAVGARDCGRLICFVLKAYVEQKQMRLQDLESHLSKECTINLSNS